MLSLQLSRQWGILINFKLKNPLKLLGSERENCYEKESRRNRLQNKSTNQV